MKNRIWLIIKLIFGIGILIIVVRTVDFQKFSSRIYSINYYLLFIVWLLYIFDRVLMAFKWNLLLHEVGVIIPLWQSIKIYYVGTLLGTFTPGNIGGDAYRIVALSNFKKNKIVASTLILERIVGFSVLATFAIALLPFSQKILGINLEINFGITILLIFVLGVFYLIIFYPLESIKIFLKLNAFQRFQIVKKINEAINVYSKNIQKKKLIYFVLLSTLEVVLIIYMNYLTSQALNIKVSFLFYLVTLPILYILIRLPITVQGIGLQEGLWVYVLTLAGFAAADGLSLSLLLRLMQIFSIYLPAIIMMSIGSLKVKATTALKC